MKYKKIKRIKSLKLIMQMMHYDDWDGSISSDKSEYRHYLQSLNLDEQDLIDIASNHYVERNYLMDRCDFLHLSVRQLEDHSESLKKKFNDMLIGPILKMGLERVMNSQSS